MSPGRGQDLLGDPRVTCSFSRGVAPMPGQLVFRDPIENCLLVVDHLVLGLAHPVVEIAEFEFFAFEGVSTNDWRSDGPTSPPAV